MPTLQDVKADTAKLIDVGVEYLSEEANLRRRHRVVVGEEQLELKGAACDRLGVSRVCPAAIDWS